VEGLFDVPVDATKFSLLFLYQIISKGCVKLIAKMKIPLSSGYWNMGISQ
jgi:hypothetical protein